jgi:hypothetical protein
MSIKFEGKPPFYLGIAEVASAHALDGSVVLRATISVPELRPKSVPVQFIVATEVAKALAEQLPIAVRMAEAQSSKEARVVVPNTRGGDLTPRRPYRRARHAESGWGYALANRGHDTRALPRGLESFRQKKRGSC